ncbi:MAG TPA: DUF4129 domain-containing protein [Pyrinomonadaceae bacterium]|jgi:hypothetical protein|nr:DUF4129 domain-containing protein [Pyrinomonadaceae bacterium]
MRRTVFIVLASILLVAVAAAATPGNYRTRIDRAVADANELINNVGSGESDYERQRLERVRSAVPPAEKIEWPDGSVETQNQWLKVDLDILETERSLDRRRAILNSIRERLEALSESVAELGRAVTASSSKDADKQKLGEILRRPEYQPAVEKEESLFQRWWRELQEWLDRQFPRPQITPSEQLGLGSFKLVLQIVIFVAILGLVAFLLWRFLPLFSARFGERRKKAKNDRVILGELVGADESAADIFGEAERLAREGDIRGAIRKGYIAVLCELGDRRIVRLARHKTNRDYLRDARRSPRIFDGLSGLTANFERNWYGLRTAEPEDWDDFRTGYQQTIREVKMYVS